MNHRRTISTTRKAALGAIALVAMACCYAQAPQSPQHKEVPLVPDACPAVRIGDSISFDWNAQFDPMWPVTGLRDVTLRFAAVADDGVNLAQGQRVFLGGHFSSSVVTPQGNGFYRVSIALRPRSPSVHIGPGVYRMIGAGATAEVVPEYTHQAPQMLNTPVDERYCITVVRSTAP